MPFMKSSRSAILSVRAERSKALLQLVSGANHFASFILKFGLQVLPVVARFLVVLLFVDGTHDIQNREPPKSLFLVPNGANLIVLIESERYLVHCCACLRLRLQR